MPNNVKPLVTTEQAAAANEKIENFHLLIEEKFKTTNSVCSLPKYWLFAKPQTTDSKVDANPLSLSTGLLSRRSPY